VVSLVYKDKEPMNLPKAGGLLHWLRLR